MGRSPYTEIVLFSLLFTLEEQSGTMTIERRKSERVVDFFPLEIHALHLVSHKVIAGPFSGRIIDISDHGACLLMTQVLVNGFHIFHTTRNTDGVAIGLGFTNISAGDSLVFTAHPVWLKPFQQQEVRAFRMGVQFTAEARLDHIHEVQEALGADQEQRASWWKLHCKT